MSKKVKSVDSSNGAPTKAALAGSVKWTTFRKSALVLFFFAIGLAAYSNTFRSPFVFDDLPAIVRNAKIRALWPPWSALNSPRDTTAAGRPILSLSLALNYAISADRVWSYHCFNLVTHILAALTLFGIVRRTLRCPRLRSRFEDPSSALALTISLVWMVHPIQTESVTYIIQRAESLVGLFYLLTLYCAIRGFESSKPNPWFIAAAIVSVLGMATKEVMVSAPPIILIYERIFYSESFKRALERSGTLYAGLALSWFVLATLVANNPRGKSVGFEFENVTPYRYAITQSGVLLHYLRIALWPSELCFYYQWPVAKSILEVWPYALALTGLLGATLWALVRALPVAFLGAWFFAILAPSSSFVPIVTEIAAEHRMYLPLAALISGVVIAAFLMISPAADRSKRHTRDAWRTPTSAKAVLVGILLALAIQTYRRNRDYRDELTLWNDTVVKQPSNFMAQANLGYYLLWQGAAEEALPHFIEAVRLEPNFAQALQGAARCLIEKGRLEEAIPYLQRALRVKPEDEDTYMGMGRAFIGLGKAGPAIQFLEQALRMNPNSADAQYNLGISLGQLQRTEESIGHYRAAIRLQPDFILAYNNLGNALLAKGQYEEALDEYSRAAIVKPEDSMTHANLAAAFYALRRFAEAWSEIRTCRKLGGHPPEKLVGLLMAEMPEPR